MNLCYTCLIGDYSLLTIEFDLHRRLGFHMIQVRLFRYAYSRPREQGVQQPRSQRPLLPVPRSESLAPGDYNKHAVTLTGKNFSKIICECKDSPHYFDCRQLIDQELTVRANRINRPHFNSWVALSSQLD